MKRTIRLMRQIETERANLNRLIDISFQKNGKIIVDKEINKSSQILDRLCVKLFDKNNG